MSRPIALLVLMLLSGCIRLPSCPPLANAGSGETGRAGQPYGLAEIDALDCHRRRGDKFAALELGRRFEEGRGVGRNLRRAAKLYDEAAEYTSGTSYVYSAPVGAESYGRVLPIRTGVDRIGLPEAQYRLGLMRRDGHGLDRNVDKARKLLARAAEAGFRPAREALQALPAS